MSENATQILRTSHPEHPQGQKISGRLEALPKYLKLITGWQKLEHDDPRRWSDYFRYGSSDKDRRLKEGFLSVLSDIGSWVQEGKNPSDKTVRRAWVEEKVASYLKPVKEDSLSQNTWNPEKLAAAFISGGVREAKHKKLKRIGVGAASLGAIATSAVAAAHLFPGLFGGKAPEAPEPLPSRTLAGLVTPAAGETPLSPGSSAAFVEAEPTPLGSGDPPEFPKEDYDRSIDMRPSLDFTREFYEGYQFDPVGAYFFTPGHVPPDSIQNGLSPGEFEEIGGKLRKFIRTSALSFEERSDRNYTTSWRNRTDGTDLTSVSVSPFGDGERFRVELQDRGSFNSVPLQVMLDGDTCVLDVKGDLDKLIKVKMGKEGCVVVVLSRRLALIHIAPESEEKGPHTLTVSNGRNSYNISVAILQAPFPPG